MSNETIDQTGAGRRPRRRASRSAGPPVAESGVAEHTVVGVSASKAPEATPVEPDRPRRKRSTVLLVVGASALAALIAAVAVLAWVNWSNDRRDTRRGEFVQAARQTVLNLTTIHPDTAKQDVDRILADASGDFKAEFDGRVDPFVGIVEQAKVTTNGEIVEAGLEREYGDSADVLVAARSMVTNGNDAQPSARDFRLRVTITIEGGRYTTSKVEFVA